MLIACSNGDVAAGPAYIQIKDDTLLGEARQLRAGGEVPDIGIPIVAAHREVRVVAREMDWIDRAARLPAAQELPG